MIEFIKYVNNRITELSKEISEETERRTKLSNSKDEEIKIKYISIYYRTVLEGAKCFSLDALKKKKDIEYANADIELDENPNIKINEAAVSPDVDIEQEKNNIPDNLINVKVADLSEPFEIDENVFDRIKKEAAKRRERMVAKAMEDNNKDSVYYMSDSNIPINIEVSDTSEDIDDIELDENPKIEMEVSDVSLDIDDIALDENPEIKMEVSDVSPDIDDIALDENPEINMEVSDVSLDIDDIALDENPEIKMEVSDVSPDIDDIALDENPEIKMEVSDVSPDIDDIALDENPEINVKVSETSNDIALDENHEAKAEVSKVSEDKI